MENGGINWRDPTAEGEEEKEKKEGKERPNRTEEKHNSDNDHGWYWAAFLHISFPQPIVLLI